MKVWISKLASKPGFFGLGDGDGKQLAIQPVLLLPAFESREACEAWGPVLLSIEVDEPEPGDASQG